jgi:hypothetical protein
MRTGKSAAPPPRRLTITIPIPTGFPLLVALFAIGTVAAAALSGSFRAPGQASSTAAHRAVAAVPAKPAVSAPAQAALVAAPPAPNPPDSTTPPGPNPPDSTPGGDPTTPVAPPPAPPVPVEPPAPARLAAPLVAKPAVAKHVDRDEPGERKERSRHGDTDERSEKKAPVQMAPPTPPAPVCRPAHSCLPTPICSRPPRLRPGEGVFLCYSPPAVPTRHRSTNISSPVDSQWKQGKTRTPTNQPLRSGNLCSPTGAQPLCAASLGVLH